MSKDFKSDFSKALEIINENRNLSLIEKATEIFAVSESNQENYVNFQLQLLSIIGTDYTPALMHYFKTGEEFTPEKNQRTTYATIRNIRLLISNKLNTIEQSLSNPFKITSNMFTYSDESPHHLLSTFVRGDGTDFKFLMSFNDGLLLLTSLMNNLSDKFDKGANTIDRNIYYQFKETSEKFQGKIDNLINLEDSQKNE